MTTPTAIEVAVRQTTGTYQTAAVNGVKASCTAGEQQAAEAFGRKYFGPAFVGVELVQPSTSFKPSTWRVSADPKAYAWAWATGLIEIHDELPVGPDTAIAFASGPRRALELILGGVARHGWGVCEGQLLVPGVAENKHVEDALIALNLWVNRNRASNGAARLHTVVFGLGDGEL
ncbi:MAG: hypothetical protein AB7P37_21120 [Ramlibacter sp.]